MYIEIIVEAAVGHVGGLTPVDKAVFSAPVPSEVTAAMQAWLAQVPQDLPRERVIISCVLHNTNGSPVAGGPMPITVG